MAAKKRTRNSSVKHVLVRGSRKNPVPMLASARKGTLTKLAKLLKGHFPGSRVRVEKVKLS